MVRRFVDMGFLTGTAGAGMALERVLPLVRRGGEKWRKPANVGYPKEAQLQRLIWETPHFIPGFSDEGSVVVREFRAGTGSVDVVCVDGDGNVAVVECKLARNSQFRKYVVGQALWYASSLWRLSYDEFDEAFRARAGQSLAESLSRVLAEEWDEEGFRAAISLNLEEGNFYVVVAVDEIDEELKGIIEYLNEHTLPSTRVLALELAWAQDGDVELLFPRVYGEEGIRKKRGGDKTVWNADRVFEALERTTTVEGVNAVRRIYEFTQSHPRGAIEYPKTMNPSLAGSFEIDGARATVWQCVVWGLGEDTATMTLRFHNMASAGVPLARISHFAHALKGMIGDERLAELQAKGFRGKRELPIDKVLAGPDATDVFVAALDAFVGAEPLVSGAISTEAAGQPDDL